MTVADYLSLARAVVAATGPAPQANDVGEIQLAFAQANHETLLGGWCNCGDPRPTEVYFRSPDGSHGWMCAGCLRVTQVG